MPFLMNGDGYGVPPHLVDLETNEILYYGSYGWSYWSSVNLFIDHFVLARGENGIDVLDFTTYPFTYETTILAPGSTLFLNWKVKGDNLFVGAAGGASSLYVFDITDPVAPRCVRGIAQLGNSESTKISINGSLLTMVDANGPDYRFDISDPIDPVLTDAPDYPGEVFGDVVLEHSGPDLQVYRTTAPGQWERIGSYWHGAEIITAKRVRNSILVMDAFGITSLVDFCNPTVAGIETDDRIAGRSVPASVGVVAATPNPFNPTTRISFRLGRSQSVRVEVFDVSGQMIAVLFSGEQVAGSHEVEWNGLDTAGRRVASGPYIVRVAGEDSFSARKITLLK